MAGVNVADQVEAKINKKRVVIIAKSSCPFCKQAKEVLKSYPKTLLAVKDLEIWNIDSDQNCTKIQDYLKKRNQVRTVPQVFIGGKFIGGCDDTLKIHKNGKLEAKLKEVNALYDEQQQ